jgi:hypothetical protein
MTFCTAFYQCVADPDPNPDQDPHVFGPPGSGSGSISQACLLSYVLNVMDPQHCLL